MILEVIEEIEPRLMAKLGIDSALKPSFEVGADGLARQDGPPRIVWVPRGGAHDRKALTSRDGDRSTRVLWTRHMRMEAHVWGPGITETEQMCAALVDVLDDLFSGSYSMIGEEWDTRNVASCGILALLSFEVRMPWTKMRLTMVKPTTPVPSGTIETQGS